MLLEDYLRGVVAAALPADAPLEAQKALAVAARTFAAHTHRHLEQSADVCTTRHCQAWTLRANPRAARAVMETRSVVATFNDVFIEAFHFDHCDGKTRGATGVLVNAPAYLKSVSCPCGSAAVKGHGIGMCRRGMVVMARFGESYDYILKHYYSDVTLEQIGIDQTTRVKLSPTPKRTPAPEAKPSPRPAPRVRKTQTPPVAPVPGEMAAPTETPAPAEPAPAQAADKPSAPRRSSRAKIEQGAPGEEKTPAQTPAPLPPMPPPHAVESKPEIEEADDFVSFLAVEDIEPKPAAQPKPEPPAPKPETPGPKPETFAPKRVVRPRPVVPPPKPTAPPPPLSLDDALHVALGYDDASPARAGTPPPSFAPPPMSMPEELPEAAAPSAFNAAPPPASMPEEMPNALELEFIAPPTGAPEELGSDFLAPPMASIIEPDLETFMPPVERFFTPLDAPPSLPEDMPSFNAERADETPIAWVPPPPLFENESGVHQPQVLLDYLPGPRVIAGNLARPGMLITVRDAAGNSIVTVSGVAKQYGAGGFEAPLTDNGAYHVKFDHTELDVKLQDETVFVYYQ